MADISKIAANGIEYDVTDLAAGAEIQDANADITELRSALTADEADIADLQSDMTTAQGNISALQNDVSSLKNLLQYVEETVYVTFSAGTIGTRGFQKKLSSPALSGKKIIGTSITYIANSADIIPVLFSAGSDLYLNAYRATASAVNNNEVRVRFTFA
jgi:hypothetical protein